jgi:hypothetical protein
VQGEAIFVGVDPHGPDAQLGGGTHHANGDLAAVCYEQAADFFHNYHPKNVARTRTGISDQWQVE